MDGDLVSINRILGRGRYVLVGASFNDAGDVAGIDVKMVGIENGLALAMLEQVVKSMREQVKR